MRKSEEIITIIIDEMNTKRISPAELSRRLSMPKSTLSRYLNKSRQFPVDKSDEFARALNISTEYLLGVQAYQKSENLNNHDVVIYMNVPLYHSISCGVGAFVEDNTEEYIQISDRLLNPNKQYFAQVAYGDSMIEENIKSGDVLVFEKTPNIENGQVGCFCIDDNVATCKKFYKDDSNNIIMLQPANSNYSPIVVTVENMGFHVVGKLSLVINKRD